MGCGVRFYHQTFDFTCGPACLIMAMRAFDPAVRPTRELELDIWREANLVETYAVSRRGLALAAHRRGFDVETIGSTRSVELLDALIKGLSGENRRVAALLYGDMERRCRRAGIRDTVRPVALRDVSSYLSSGRVPILLTDARLVSDEALPHWVVVCELDGGRAVIHNPLARKGHTPVPLGEMERWLGFRGITWLVGVGPRRGQPRAGTV